MVTMGIQKQEQTWALLHRKHNIIKQVKDWIQEMEEKKKSPRELSSLTQSERWLVTRVLLLIRPLDIAGILLTVRGEQN